MRWHLVQQTADEIFLMYKQLNVTDKGEMPLAYEPPTFFPRVMNIMLNPCRNSWFVAHIREEGKGTKQGGCKTLTGGPMGPGGPGKPVEP